METLQVIAPLIGVVLGSAISGIGAHLRARAEKRRVIARALSDLLEIRHHVIGIETVLREVRSRVQFSEEDAQLLREYMNLVVPLDTEIHKRYDEAISLLAGTDPVLAFNMRSKNKVPQFLDSLKSLSSSFGTTPSQFSSFAGVIRSAITPALDKAVLALAAQHSSSTKRKVKALVVSTGQVPPELTDLLNSVASSSPADGPGHGNKSAG